MALSVDLSIIVPALNEESAWPPSSSACARISCQRYCYYTLDEHIHFFPFKEALTSAIPLENYHCEQMKGGWVYLGDVERRS